jgi:uncharacterized membrane protein YebE (DUF533 family)
MNQPARAIEAYDLVVQALAAACRYPADPRVLRDLVRSMGDRLGAQELYQLTSDHADRRLPAHRVFLEDLIEALALPVRLERDISLVSPPPPMLRRTG